MSDGFDDVDAALMASRAVCQLMVSDMAAPSWA
jgi:hypothetical protein